MKVCCPICGKETEYEGNPFRPFCSGACKERDLIHWANERYSIPGQGIQKKDENDDNKEGS